MAYTFDALFTSPSSGAVIAATDVSNNVTAIKNELIARLAVNPFNGVISGFEPTEDEANDEIDLAAGVAFVEGKQCVGGVSVTLLGEGADNYYVYIDPTEANEASAYKVKNTVPTQAELLLAYCTWNGTDTITSFIDLRQWGIMPGQVCYSTVAAVSAATVFRTIMPYPVCIRRPYLVVDTCGSADGPTLVDIHTGTAGSTASIWAAAGSRFSIAHDATDGALVTGNIPDQNFKLTAGQLVEIIVDAAATDLVGLHVVVPYTYY